MKIELENLCLTITVGDVCFGVGWWVPGHWKKLNGWINWARTYYDGRWFHVRLGPFFYSRGPY